MTPTVVVLALAALWHALAAWHFALFPGRTLARTTRERPVNPIAAELFRFLGGLNLALVGLGVGACFAPREAQVLAAACLSLANLTQFVQDLRVRRADLARGPFFLQILVGDGLFTVLCGAAAVGRWTGLVG